MHTHKTFYLPETAAQFDFSVYDYVVDAIDSVTSKILLIEECIKNNVPIISSMGTGNKLDPTAFKVTDIQKTNTCPLARVMRRELKARGIKKYKVVYSKEEPRKSGVTDPETGKAIPGSLSFVPSAVGLIMAGEIVNQLVKG